MSVTPMSDRGDQIAENSQQLLLALSSRTGLTGKGSKGSEMNRSASRLGTAASRADPPFMAQFQHRDFTDFLPTVRFPRLLPAAWRPAHDPRPTCSGCRAMRSVVRTAASKSA